MWKQVVREAVEYPVLETFKIQLDETMSQLM